MNVFIVALVIIRVCVCVCVCNVKAEQYSYRIIYVDYNSGFRLYLYNRIKLEG